jgi:hypothetical protein
MGRKAHILQNVKWRNGEDKDKHIKTEIGHNATFSMRRTGCSLLPLGTHAPRH